MTRELKCPVCGNDIEIDDVYDSSSWNDNDIIQFGYGHCAECEKDYSFTMFYNFLGYGKIAEM